MRFSSTIRAALAVATTLGAVTGPAVLGPATVNAAVVERVVAVVGEKAILLSDLRQRARPFLVRVYESVPPGAQQSAAISQVYRAVLERMLEEELEDRAAARAGIVVTGQEIDQALQRVAAQNGLTPSGLIAEAKRSGLSEAQYRDELRRQVLQAKLVNVRLQGRIRVAESDLRAMYGQMVLQERQQLMQRLSYLTLPAGQTEEERQRQLALADSIVERARAGEDFRALVEQYSSNPEAALSEPRQPQAEPEAIRRASLALDVGQVSRPVRLGSQLVILQVVEREQSQLPAYEEARPGLHERVYLEKMNSARQHWLDGLRRRTHVDIRL